MAGLVLLVTGTRMPLTRKGMHVISGVLDGAISPLTDDQALIVMHGNCPTGVDAYVQNESLIASDFLWPFPAKWKEQGKPAGMARNTHMVKLAQGFKLYGHTVRVLAFPSLTMGTGTQHCIKEAKRFDLDVKVFPLEPGIHHNLTK